MFSLILLGLIASAFAAPQFDFSHHEHPYVPDFHMRTPHSRSDDVFDTSRFWADISKELREIDDMLADFTRRFPTATRSQQGIEGNDYKITIPLSGFEEKDVVVKARVGLLMIQANHKYDQGSERNYLDIRTLPDTVNVNGTWIFEKSVLKITFPLKEGATTEETVNVMSTDVTTLRPTFGDREELDETHVTASEGTQDADVGLGDTELITNQIPEKSAVEATTYAVDLKDEVEFVPVRF